MEAAAPSEILVLLAEVSVAIAGFAGIVGAIAKPSDEAATADLKALVYGAVGVLFFAIVPLVASLSEFARPALWRLSATLLSAYVVCYYWLNRGDFPQVFTSIRWVAIATGDLVMLLALLAVAAGFSASGAVVYLASLVWILSQTLIFFALAMASLWRAPSAQE